MNFSLRSPRAVCGLLALLTALACVLMLAPGRALADSSTLSVSPAGGITFPAVQIGQTATSTLTLTNNGSDSVLIGGYGLKALNNNHVTAVDVQYSASSLAPGASTTVTVTFTPVADEIDDYTLTLQATDVATNPATTASVDVPLQGSGPLPQVSVDQPVFGDAVIGEPDIQTVTVTNTGNANLNVQSPTISGTNANQFAVTDDSCNAGPVAAGGNCSIDVQFNPTARGAQTAELDIPSNDPNMPTTSIPLSGTGETPGTISVDKTSAAFGSVTIGQASDATVTVTNTGDLPLAIKNPMLDGANANQFAVTSSTCPTVLSPVQTRLAHGATCTVGVQFAPTAAGAQSAQLELVGPQGPTVIDLSGTGAAAAQPTTPTTPAQPVHIAQPTQPAQTQPTAPTQIQPTQTLKLVQRVAQVGRAATAQGLLAHGEKLRVYCNQACTLKVALQVYERAITRGRGYQKKMQAYLVRKPQPSTRVTVGQATVKLGHAGYKTITVKVARAHRTVVADAGSILLGVYTHGGKTLVAKRWLQVKGPDMNAKVSQAKAKAHSKKD